MRDLRLVGISEDRRSVVLLADDTGEQFRVAADESLRAALRGDRARLGQLETQMDSALRPRDIQARIRAGATPEEVADVAKVPVERVMGYAVPVLAEREHMAEQARKASVRRRHTEGPTRMLGDTIVTRLRSLGLDPDTVRWDSWRRDDGRWMVTVTPPGEQDVAHYAYDAPGRYVVAEDDAARRLIADEPATEDPSTMAVAAAVQTPPSGPVPVDAPDWSPPDTDSADGVASTADELGDDSAPSPVTRLRRRSLHQVPEPLPLDEPSAEGLDSGASAEASTGSSQPAPRPEPQRRRDRRRASVPSWDEIMFGGKSK